MTRMAGNESKEIELFVPGRLCLFGEHSDWAAEYGIHKGYCLVIGTDQGITAMVRKSNRFVVETKICDNLGRATGRMRQMSCTWKGQTLLSAATDQTEFFRYCAGVAYEIQNRWKVSGGVEIRITSMDLPLKKGVSSSAAVCILVAKAFDAAYKLGMFPHELMDMAYLGEKVTGSQCGRMDQACIYGKTPVLLMFEKSKDVSVEPVFTGSDVHMFFVDLGGKKDTVKILSDLQGNYMKSDKLQKALGQSNEHIARMAYQALSAGDAKTLGALMREAQKNFDADIALYSPKELKSPLLHKVLEFKDIAKHIYGGKGVGSQGDGTAQFVAKSVEDRNAAMARIEKAFEQMRCFPLVIPRGAAS